MPIDRSVLVQWQISSDEHMRKIVRRGSAWAYPELGHSVHVEVEGLQAARWYWYQFTVGREESPIGRTRTAPDFRSPDRVRFAFVSCQHYANGLYYSHRHMAQENLDFAVHLGTISTRGGRPARSTGRTCRTTRLRR